MLTLPPESSVQSLRTFDILDIDVTTNLFHKMKNKDKKARHANTGAYESIYVKGGGRHFFEKNIYNFFNYVNYSFIYTLPYNKC